MVRFIQGVPFDNNYAHTRWFTTRTEQFNYFNSFPKIERSQNNFQKSTGRMAIDVSEHVETMMNYDYLMYKNNDYGNKWFYAFILNVEYIDARTTRVYFEIDPIQTYMFDVDIKSSYVVREHEDVSDNYYPEGMQKGSEYTPVHTWDIKPYPFYFMVIVTKQRIDNSYEDSEPPFESENDGTFRGTPDSLNYYWYPIPRRTLDMTMTAPLTDEHNVNITASEINEILRLLRTEQGMVDNVVSIYLTDYLPLEITNTGNDYRVLGSYKERIGMESANHGAWVFRISSVAQSSLNRDFPDLIMDVGNVFTHLSESEPKLRYFPYTIIEVSDARGNVVNYKPEGFLNKNGDLQLRIMGGITHQNTVAYGLQGYNGNNSRAGVLEHAIINTDPQDIAIVNSQASAYLQGAKNSMQAKRNTWATSRDYQQDSAIVRGATGLFKTLGAGIGVGNKSMNLGYGMNALAEGMGGALQSQFDYQYAGAEYQNNIAEQNAQVEDLMNLPPSLQKQGNNPSFNIGYNMQGVRIRIKRILPQYLVRAREYLKMFGTQTNRLKVPNLRTRTHFNYIQTTMLNVQSDIYNDDIQRFKQIFDSGITLWHTNDIYNYNVTNNKR